MESLDALYEHASFMDRVLVGLMLVFNVPVKLIGGGPFQHRDRRPLMARWVLASWRERKLVLHQFIRGDHREQGVHDHPWACTSLVVKGSYVEHVAAPAGQALRVSVRSAGSLQSNPPGYRHIVTLVNGKADGTSGHCWTVALLGPRVRAWGFPDVPELRVVGR